MHQTGGQIEYVYLVITCQMIPNIVTDTERVCAQINLTDGNGTVQICLSVSGVKAALSDNKVCVCILKV